MSHALRRSVISLVFCAITLVAPWARAAFEVVSGSFKYEDRIVVAGEQGLTMKFPSGLILELSAGGRLRQHKDADLWMAAGGKTPTEIFSLAAGRVHAFRPQREGKREVGALVRTSRKLMGVTVDGEFLAIADKDEGIVATYRGTTLLSVGASWTKVPEGQYGKVTRALPKVVVIDLPKAPTVAVSKTLWMSLQDKAKIEGLRWSKSSSDIQFKLTVRRSDSGEQAAALTLSETTLAPGRLALGPGQYEAMVQAINGYGLIGPYSAPARLRVVGVKTHRGARIDSRGTVHLAANQRAEFVNVEGLLMTYGNSNRWAPATASVPLHDHEPVFVHFREQNSADVVSARLEPRGVVADVYVGSKLAQWPGDPVEVVVKLRDESGELADGSLVPNLEVTLGIAPLSLQWEHSGATWRASIPAQPGPGPWVVRASVTDEHGVELGRDFLEIAERPSSSTHRAPPTAKLSSANPRATVARAK